MRRLALVGWVWAASCAPFEDARVAEVPLPADAAACLDAHDRALDALGAPAMERSACLYLPELECALRVPLASLCPPGGGCTFAGWSAPTCTRGGAPEAELGRDAPIAATLRLVTGAECPAHEDVFASGAPRGCEGSAVTGAPEGCFARLDFELQTNAEGQLRPVDDRIDAALSGLYAEELERAGAALPCGGTTEPFDTGRVCVALEGAGTGTVTSAAFPELGCARTSSVAPITECAERELAAGRTLTLTASAAGCSSLSGWTGACSGSSCTLTVRPGATCDENRAVARFERAVTGLDITVEGGGEIRVEPYASECAPGDACPAVCTTSSPCLLELPCGVRPTLVARPAPGFELSTWGEPGCGLESDRCPLPPVSRRRQLAVRFAQGEQTLRVAPSGLCAERVTGPRNLDCGGARTAPGDCERRVAELAPVELRLETSREARVLDWGVDCGALASCVEGARSLRFEMPAREVVIAPRAAYPSRLRIEGPGEVDAFGAATCSGPGPCPEADVACTAQTTLRSVPRSLPGCDSDILSWTVDGSPACESEPRVCTLPPPEGPRSIVATFGLPVVTRVVDGGEVTVSAGPRSVTCAGNDCAGATTAPLFPADAAILVTAPPSGPAPLCFAGCDAVDLGNRRCTLVNSSCRAPSVRFGRRVSVDVGGNCRVTAPAPTPRSSGGRACRDEAALDLSGPSARGSRVYAAGPVTLTARGTAPDEEVVSFELCNAAGTCTPSAVPAPSGGAFTLSIPGTGDVEARVRCEPVYVIEVEVRGPGSVSDGAGPIQSCRSSSGVCVHRAPASATSSLTPSPDAGARFLGWSAVAGSQPCADTANPCRFRPLEDLTLRAVFADEVDLDVQIQTTPTGAPGGEVRSITTGGPTPPSEIACPSGACRVTRVRTQSVSLEATPNPGFRFDGFAGDCSSTGARTCAVSRLDVDRSVRARFIALRDLAVDVTGGTVSAPGLGCAAGRCTGTYDHGASVTITAVPPGAGTYSYAWSGACAGTSGASCTLTLTTDATAALTITEETLDVDVSVIGAFAGPRVTSSPAAIDCAPGGVGTCAASFDLSSTVVLTAASVIDTRLEWGGACAGQTGATCSLDAGGSATTVTRSATLEYVPLSEVEVTVRDDPNARVSSTPAGISGCSVALSPCAASFETGSTVRLTVTGSTLTPSFSGGCPAVAGDPFSCELSAPNNRGATRSIGVAF